MLHFITFTILAFCQSAILQKAVEKSEGSNYIVVLKDVASKSTNTLGTMNARLDDHLSSMTSKFSTMAKGTNDVVEHFRVLDEYRHLPGLTAYSASLSQTALDALLESDAVDYVEEDGVVQAAQCVSQSISSQWGLPRINTDRATSSTTYSYIDSNFTGVEVYVHDTGIRRSHVEFQNPAGRARFGFDGTTNNPPMNDPQGHGTHVAGTVGGTILGVAKRVPLVDVRVLGADGRGTTSGIIAGVNFAVADSRQRSIRGINCMSLGGGFSSAMNGAVSAASSAGMLTVAASGNWNIDACQISPASEPSAITVNWATQADQGHPSSNFGPCTDIWAPGDRIFSASHLADNSGVTFSGTSMAAPHIAGIAARLWAATPSLTAGQLRARVLNTATTGRISNLRGSPSRFGFIPPC